MHFSSLAAVSFPGSGWSEHSCIDTSRGAHAVFVVGPAPLSVSQTVHRANMNEVDPWISTTVDTYAFKTYIYLKDT